MITTQVRKTTVVHPQEMTPKRRMWLSNVDLVVPIYHARTIFLYKPNGSLDFFDPNSVKDGLARALVHFYPLAGRLKRDDKGRVEIDCNDEGALFVEAETMSVLDDLGDFSPSKLMSLIPMIDYSGGISSPPLLVVQVTYFKCGGVALGVGMQHLVADGISALHFINSWAEMSKGLNLTTTPFMDRTLLKGRDPLQPKFHHIEYDLPPKPITQNHQEATVSIFKITRDQINSLKHNAQEYTSYEILSGHVWRCACNARGLSDSQETKLYIAMNARSRLQPSLPQGYFGNAILSTTPMARVGELVSKPASYAASKIHEAVTRMDVEYSRSAIDYLEMQPDPTLLSRGAHTFGSPNLSISSWSGMGIHEADFGWGRPMFMGPASLPFEGSAYILPTPENNGSFSVLIALQDQHTMKLFEHHFYDI